MKLKAFLNLLISDLLRVILAVFLFFVVLAITVGVISYRQWYPAMTDYLHALGSATATSTTSAK